MKHTFETRNPGLQLEAFEEKYYYFERTENSTRFQASVVV
jgi:hypothetical protein